jgi:hypothetical protein
MTSGFIKSQFASRNSLLRQMWSKFGHVSLGYPSQQNPCTPPSGVLPPIARSPALTSSSLPESNNVAGQAGIINPRWPSRGFFFFIPRRAYPPIRPEAGPSVPRRADLTGGARASGSGRVRGRVLRHVPSRPSGSRGSRGTGPRTCVRIAVD